MKWYVVTLRNNQTLKTPAKNVLEAIKQVNAKPTEIVAIRESL